MDREIIEFISNDLVMFSSDITAESSIRGDLALDSLTFENLLAALEEEYCVTFEESIMKEFRTIGDIITYIKENK